METIYIGIIEDDKVIHQSLVKSIEMYPALELSFDAYSVEEAFELVNQGLKTIPDVILLDIGLPGMDGLTALPKIKDTLENSDVIMLTTFDDTETIFKALCAGACSYISKKTSLKLIMDAVFTVFRGGSYMSPSIARKLVDHFKPIKEIKEENNTVLTERQLSIVKSLSEGLTYKRISENMDISIDTVRSHIKKIYKKLQVKSKVEAINLYRDGKLNSQA